MTDIDDCNPDDGREPEPDSDLLGPEELLEAIDDPQARATVEALLADVRYLRGLETREEWAVTDGLKFPPHPDDQLTEGGTAEKAFKYARAEGGQAWRRTLTVHPWEPIDGEAPF